MFFSVEEYNRAEICVRSNLQSKRLSCSQYSQRNLLTTLWLWIQKNPDFKKLQEERPSLTKNKIHWKRKDREESMHVKRGLENIQNETGELVLTRQMSEINQEIIIIKIRIKITFWRLGGSWDRAGLNGGLTRWGNVQFLNLGGGYKSIQHTIIIKLYICFILFSVSVLCLKCIF